MLDAPTGAIRCLAGHFMLRPAHGVAYFAGQGLALTGSQRRNRRQPNQHLHPKNSSRNSIHFHLAFFSCENGVMVQKWTVHDLTITMSLSSCQYKGSRATFPLQAYCCFYNAQFSTLLLLETDFHVHV